MKEKEQKVTVSAKITEQEKMDFEDYCWCRRLTKSEVLRKALKEYMENHR